MRPALAVALVLAVLAPAHAQTVSPEVRSIAFPLAVRTTLARSSEMGCSQSFESDQGTAHVTLLIDAGGRVTLSLEGDYGTTSGPSFGRYQAGDHDFSHVREVHRSTWTGNATTLPDGIAIALHHVDAAEMRTSGYGTLPLPAPTGHAFTGGLQCHVERVDVLPAVAVDGERATSTRLLRCAWSGTPASPFDRYTDASAFALGAGGGVVDSVDERMWGGPGGHVVRLVP